MKKLMILLIALTVSSHAVSQDKFDHAFAGTIIYAVCLMTGGVLDEMDYEHPLTTAGCLIPVLVAGIGKEIYDDDGEFADVAYTMAIPVTFSVVFYKW